VVLAQARPNSCFSDGGVDLDAVTLSQSRPAIAAVGSVLQLGLPPGLPPKRQGRPSAGDFHRRATSPSSPAFTLFPARVLKSRSASPPASDRHRGQPRLRKGEALCPQRAPENRGRQLGTKAPKSPAGTGRQVRLELFEKKGEGGQPF